MLMEKLFPTTVCLRQLYFRLAYEFSICLFTKTLRKKMKCGIWEATSKLKNYHVKIVLVNQLVLTQIMY